MTFHNLTKKPEFYRSYELFKTPSQSIFALLYQTIPSMRVIRFRHPVVNLITHFRKKFKIGNENFFCSENYHHQAKKFLHYQTIFNVAPHLIVEISNARENPEATVVYSHETDVSILNEVIDTFKSLIIDTQNTRIGLLTSDFYGLDLTNFPIENNPIDINLIYNDDFKPIHDIIVSRLSESRTKGMVLLHGLPGTGKTTYLRHLASIIQKQMIFIPFEAATRIASPDFLTFLLDYRNSILILEDAEKLLRSREDGDNLNVANLLNISDGLLSDVLHIQLICTFNTSIESLDKALLRKGRIIARYEFRHLSVEKSNALAKYIGHSEEINQSLTLAEIFNLTTEDFDYKKERLIGFRN